MLRLLLIFTLLFNTCLANAVERADRGQVLLFPFVLAQPNWDTYLNVSLSPGSNKILRIRVLDGADGSVAQSFNVYTRRAEHWRAAVTQLDTDQTVLRIAEGYCTISDSGEFGGAGTDFSFNTQVGMVEVYRVNARLDFATDNLSCSDLAARWQTGGAWDMDPDDGLFPDARLPEAEMAGHFDLIDVQNGFAAESAAIALRNFTTNLIPHTAPGVASPNLSDADSMAVMSNGEELEPASGDGIDAVALVLSSKHKMTNEVVTLEEIGASTDWVVSFPLRGYKVYATQGTQAAGNVQTCQASGYAATDPPYITELIPGSWQSWGDGMSNGQGIDIDPVPPVRYTPFLCNAVNVLSFGDRPSIFLEESAQLQHRVSANIEHAPSATLSYALTGNVEAVSATRGLPVIALRATTFSNATLQGGNVLANYMLLKPHRLE